MIVAVKDDIQIIQREVDNNGKLVYDLEEDKTQFIINPTIKPEKQAETLKTLYLKHLENRSDIQIASTCIGTSADSN